MLWSSDRRVGTEAETRALEIKARCSRDASELVAFLRRGVRNELDWTTEYSMLLMFDRLDEALSNNFGSMEAFLLSPADAQSDYLLHFFGKSREVGAQGETGPAVAMGVHATWLRTLLLGFTEEARGLAEAVEEFRRAMEDKRKAGFAKSIREGRAPWA
jgi:hypothetical protein